MGQQVGVDGGGAEDWRIILPLSKPASAVVGMFTFLGVWNDYLGPLIYLNDRTERLTCTR